MSFSKTIFISLTCVMVLSGSFTPRAEAGLLSFVGRHLFGSKKDHTKAASNSSKTKSSVSTASLPKKSQSSHPTGPFSATASWYGGKFNGRRTASGEVFNENKLTAASKTLPLGSKVLVQNPANGRACTVVINDRGPYVAGRDIDLSKAAAQRIGVTGVSPVVCIADTNGLQGPSGSHSGGLLHVPGKMLHMIAGII